MRLISPLGGKQTYVALPLCTLFFNGLVTQVIRPLFVLAMIPLWRKGQEHELQSRTI